MNIPDFSSFLGSLNNQGFLLMKGPKVYQLQTSDYWDITVYIMQQQSLTALLDNLKTSDIKQMQYLLNRTKGDTVWIAHIAL